MATFIYNGINLPYPLITDFQQKVVYDESDTDWYCTHFEITCQAVLYPAYLASISSTLVVNGQPTTGNPADIMLAIRHALLTPRKRLQVFINSTDLIPDTDSLASTRARGDNRDAQNGPHPRSCNIIDLGNMCFLIHYRIEAKYWEKTQVTVNAQGISVRRQIAGYALYNRWSESIDIDRENFATKTREGKFVIRSDNANGYFADQVRTQLAAVSINPGCVRVSANYAVTKDGLGITYRLVDKEVFKFPPAGAFVSKGKYTQYAKKGDAIRYHDISITLRGRGPGFVGDGAGTAGLLQSNLVTTAIFIVIEKIRRNGVHLLGKGEVALAADKKQTGVISYASVTVDMYENEVSVKMEFWVANPKSRIKGVTLNKEGITFTPESDSRNIPPAVTVRGNTGLLLTAAAYYDPSLTFPELKPADQEIAGGKDNDPLTFNGSKVQNPSTGNTAGKQPGQP